MCHTASSQLKRVVNFALKCLKNFVHSCTSGSSAICRACAWGLKIEHCSIFLLSSHCRDESSLIRARRHKTVCGESRALVWGPSSIPPSFWVDNAELFVTVDIHSLLEVVQRLRGERHASLGRQWCVEEASTLPAPNYKTSEWVASLKLYVCLNDASGGGGVDFELWRSARNDNSSPLSASALSLSTTSHPPLLSDDAFICCAGARQFIRAFPRVLRYI